MTNSNLVERIDFILQDDYYFIDEGLLSNMIQNIGTNIITKIADGTFKTVFKSFIKKLGIDLGGASIDLFFRLMGRYGQALPTLIFTGMAAFMTKNPADLKEFKKLFYDVGRSEVITFLSELEPKLLTVIAVPLYFADKKYNLGITQILNQKLTASEFSRIKQKVGSSFDDEDSYDDSDTEEGYVNIPKLYR